MFEEEIFGSLEEAIEIAKKELKNETQSEIRSFIYENLAKTYLKINPSASIICIEEAMKLDKNNLIAKVTAGKIYLSEKEYDKAQTYFKAAIVLSEDNVDVNTTQAHIGLGDCYLQTENIDEAANEFKEVTNQEKEIIQKSTKFTNTTKEDYKPKNIISKTDVEELKENGLYELMRRLSFKTSKLYHKNNINIIKNTYEKLLKICIQDKNKRLEIQTRINTLNKLYSKVDQYQI